jgi:hypothetical protein
MYGKNAADNWHSVGTSSDMIIVSKSCLNLDMRVPSSGAGERHVAWSLFASTEGGVRHGRR